MPDPIYQVALRHRRGPLDLDVAFALDAGWTALFAPSGAGKTTILRLIAGLDRPDRGRIECNEEVLLDTAASVFIPPHQRAIGLVAQKPALFPHLSVLKNVIYGMPAPHDGLPDIMSLCRIQHLRDKMPAQLSGGERQRVALARGVAHTSRLLLLDEPFTGLESRLRDEIIQELSGWTERRGTPVLLVTHDLGEVFAANAHVLKMESGRIAASGSAAEVLAVERDRLIQRLQRATPKL